MALHDLCIERLQAMDSAEWERFQAEYHDRVFGYIKRQVNDVEMAADLTQDAFLGAVRGISRFDSRYNLEQFLMGIARNKVIDHLRKKRPEVHFADKDDDSTGFFAGLPAESESSERVIEARERVQRQRGALVQSLREMVDELKQRGDWQRLMTIELCFLTTKSHREIAKLVGFPDEKSIAGIKFRAIRELQSRLRGKDPRRTLFSGLWKAL